MRIVSKTLVSPRGENKREGQKDNLRGTRIQAGGKSGRELFQAGEGRRNKFVNAVYTVNIRGTIITRFRARKICRVGKRGGGRERGGREAFSCPAARKRHLHP